MAWKCCFIRAPERWNYGAAKMRSEEHTSELQSQSNLVCRLLLEKKKSHLADESRAMEPRASDTPQCSIAVQRGFVCAFPAAATYAARISSAKPGGDRACPIAVRP